MTESDLDPVKSEAFASKMISVLNDAGIALLTGIGHQVGLFDIMAGDPPATSAQIAEAAGLGAMWGEQKAMQVLGEAGFGRVAVKRIEGDIFNNYYVTGKGQPE